MYFLILLWLILPIILIPLAAYLFVRNSNLNDFINNLFKSGRISWEERQNLKPSEHGQPMQTPPVMGEYNNAVNMSNVQQSQNERNEQKLNEARKRYAEKYSDGYTDAGTSWQQAPNYTALQNNAASQVFANPQPAPYPFENPNFTYGGNAAKTTAPKAKPNTAVILTIIGVCFVILAGAVFSVAAWKQMSDLQKTGLIGIAAVIFMALSLFMQKVVKLKNTSVAFYLTGSAFVSITLITAGGYELFGEWFSVYGNGNFLLFSVATLIPALLSAVAYRLYGKPLYFMNISLYCTSFTVSLLAIQIFDEYDIRMMFLNIITALFVLFYNTVKSKFDPQIRRVLKVFGCIITGFYGIAALPCLSLYDTWEIQEYVITLLWLVQLIVYGLKQNDRRLIGFQNAVAVILAFGISTDADKYLGDSYSALIFAAVIFIFGTVYFALPKLSTIVSDISYPLLTAYAAYASYEITTGVSNADKLLFRAIAMALAAALVVFTIIKLPDGKNTPYKFALPFFSIAFFLSAGSLCNNLLVEAEYSSFSFVLDYDYLDDNVFTSSLFALCCLALFAVIRFWPVIRTSFSEWILLAAAFVSGIISLNDFAYLQIYICGVVYHGTAYDDLSKVLPPIILSTLVFIACISAMTSVIFGRRRYPNDRVFLYKTFLLAPVLCLCYSLCLLTAAMTDNDTLDYILVYSGFEEKHILILLLYVCIATAAFFAVKKLRTNTSDFGFAAALFCCAMTTYETAEILAFLASWLQLAIVGFTKRDKRSGRTAATLSAFPLFCVGAALEETFAYSSVCYLMSAVVTAVLAMAFSHLNKKETFLSGAQYSYITASGIFVIVSSMWAGNIPLFICCIAASAVLYFLCLAQKSNLAGICPMISLFAAVVNLGDYVSMGETSLNRGDVLTIIFISLFVASCALSRLTFPKKPAVMIKDETRFDFMTILSAISPIMIAGTFGEFFSSDAKYFLTLIMYGVFFLNLCRKETTEKHKRILVTLASGFACSSIWVQPFADIENDIIRAKINLIPLLIFGAAVRYIWRENKKLASDFSFIVHLSALVFLIIDGLIHDSTANTVFVIVTALAILLISYALANLRWFTASGAALVGITLYAARNNLWWILLFVGILLITVAAVNEYYKTKGETFKSSMKKRWDKNQKQ